MLLVLKFCNQVFADALNQGWATGVSAGFYDDLSIRNY